MKGNDQSKADDEKPIRLTTYKPEARSFKSYISASIWGNYTKRPKTIKNLPKGKERLLSPRPEEVRLTPTKSSL